MSKGICTKRIAWDIETAALPLSEIQQFMPSEWPTGNVKDTEKLKAAIEEKKAKWLSDAALSALTAKVVAIGYLTENKMQLDIRPDDEQALIQDWWTFITDLWRSSAAQFIGFGIKRFDLPMLARRSFKLGIVVPSWIRRGRYWDDAFVDLYEQWQLGDYQSSISLDNLSKFLGIGQKSGSGADFAGLPRDKQEEYLANDVTLTAKAAAIMLPTE